MYKNPISLNEDIAYFGNLTEDFLAGKVEPIKYKATRVPMGIYEQRKDGTFMVRIRCTGGYISPLQLKGVALIANKYNSNVLHITTRQEIQIQNISLKNTKSILEEIKDLGLSTRGGGGNTVRNILVSLDSGIAKNEVFDVYPYAVSLTNKLIAESDSWTLPRKFKIAFSSTSEDKGYASFNDLGFIAKIKDGKRGFRVLIGGSLGSKPMVGYELYDFLPEEELYNVTDAAKKLFSQHGNRKNKHKARLRYVFYRLGKEKVFELFFQLLNDLKEKQSIPFTFEELSFPTTKPLLKAEQVNDNDFAIWKKRFVEEQSQPNLNTIILPFDNGITDTAKMIKIADFAASIGEDTLRFSMRQNLHFRNIPTEYLGNVYNLFQSIQLSTIEPLLLNTLVSCTGADTCRLGICLTKGANKKLKEVISKANINLDLLAHIKINISGCPNSCGQQVAADIGFFGKVGRNDRMYPAYNVVAGTRNGDNARLAELLGDVSARDLPNFTVEVLKAYQSQLNKYPVFADYFEAEGKEKIKEILANYKDIPSFEDDKNYYYDWGSDEVFSLATKGVGECSAGLFDMIEVDYNAIKKDKEELSLLTDNNAINNSLYQIAFASSRMLLITRGAEPKNDLEAFDEFIDKFITTGLIDKRYKDIVLLAKDKSPKLSNNKELILSLANDVMNLYENMDDSLQFKLDEIKAPEKNQLDSSTSLKDFRGVACPMNFVKTKIALASLNVGDKLEVLLDDGDPILNVPGSVKNEGHKVLEIKKINEYWLVKIEKA